jgi:hypothetical protein
MKLRKLALASLLTAGAGIPAVTQADSDFDIGAGAVASADLDFTVVIPEFVYFQVGAAAPGTVDEVLFDLDAGGVESGDGTNVAAFGGPVTVVLRSNADVTISASALVAATGPLATGSTEILAVSTDPVDLPVPAFGAAAPAVTGPTNATGSWTFTYDNVGVYAPGLYTDTVTYTATTL